MEHSRIKVAIYEPGFLGSRTLLVSALQRQYHEISLIDQHKDRFINDISKKYTVCSLEEADWIVWPYGKISTAELASFEKGAGHLIGTLIAFNETDSATPLHSIKVKIFRTSADENKLQENEFVMPALCSDPFFEVGQQNARTFSSFIGFCGYVGNPILHQLLKILNKKEKARGLELRWSAIRLLRKCLNANECSFILRQRFRAGLVGSINEVKLADARKQYLDNIINSKVGLAVRGAGNFSFRFYELMALGKPIVWLNENERLPYIVGKTQYPYVWRTNFDELENTAVKVSSILKENSDILALAKIESRQFWLDNLSPEGYLCNTLPAIINACH